MISTKLQYIALLGLLAFFTACKDSKKTDDANKDNEGMTIYEEVDLTKLEAIRAELQAEIPNVPKDLYEKAIALHLQFANQNPKDAFAPKALDYAQGYYDQLADYRSSLRIIDKLLEEYPNYESRKMLLYVKASHHDFLRDLDLAKATLETLLNESKNLSVDERKEIREWIEILPYTLEERIKMNN